MTRARISSGKAATALKIETPLRLDLGCGQIPRDGFLGVDRVKRDGVGVVFDLETAPWPWDSDSVEEVHCSHYLEHVREFPSFVNELWRVMKPDARALIICPYYTSVRAWQDPTHVRAISEVTFLYLNKPWRVSQKLDHYPITCDFDFSYGYAFDPAWAQRSEESRTFAAKHYVNVIQDIHVTVTKMVGR